MTGTRIQKITIAGRKGGVGKSMLARQLAVASALKDIQTLILDLDPQRTSSTWFSWRAQSGAKAPLMVQEASFDTLEAKLAAARGAGRELVLLDTPGKKGPETDQAAGVSNIVLVVVQPSMDDLVTLPDTFSLGGITSRPAFVVFNHVPNEKTFLKAKGALEPEYKVAPFYLSESEAYRQAIGEGLGVLELKPTNKAIREAQDEVRGLFEWVQARLLEHPKVPLPPTIDGFDLVAPTGRRRR